MDGTTSHPTTVDDYIAQYPIEVQSILSQIREVIEDSAPNAVEKISYNMPSYFLNGEGLVWFAVWKMHIGFYPRTAEMDASIEGLRGYKGTKGSVHIPLGEPVPYEIIRKIVQFRVAEILNT